MFPFLSERQPEKSESEDHYETLSNIFQGNLENRHMELPPPLPFPFDVVSSKTNGTKYGSTKDDFNSIFPCGGNVPPKEKHDSHYMDMTGKFPVKKLDP